MAAWQQAIIPGSAGTHVATASARPNPAVCSDPSYARGVPSPLVRLCYVTRAERRATIRLGSDTIVASGDSILDHGFFSNVSVSLLIEIRRSGLLVLADRLEGIGLVPAPDNHPEPPMEAEAANTASDQMVSATVQITFVHDDPDLSHPVPAVPG